MSENPVDLPHLVHWGLTTLLGSLIGLFYKDFKADLKGKASKADLTRLEQCMNEKADDDEVNRRFGEMLARQNSQEERQEERHNQNVALMMDIRDRLPRKE